MQTSATQTSVQAKSTTTRNMAVLLSKPESIELKEPKLGAKPIEKPVPTLEPHLEELCDMATD